MKILTRQEPHKDPEEHPWTSHTREKFMFTSEELNELEGGVVVFRGPTSYKVTEEEGAE